MSATYQVLSPGRGIFTSTRRDNILRGSTVDLRYAAMTREFIRRMEEESESLLEPLVSEVITVNGSGEVFTDIGVFRASVESGTVIRGETVVKFEHEVGEIFLVVACTEKSRGHLIGERLITGRANVGAELSTVGYVCRATVAETPLDGHEPTVVVSRYGTKSRVKLSEDPALFESNLYTGGDWVSIENVKDVEEN